MNARPIGLRSLLFCVAYTLSFCTNWDYTHSRTHTCMHTPGYIKIAHNVNIYSVMVRASGNLCRAGGSEWIPIVMVCYYYTYVLLLLGLRHLYCWLLTAVSVYSVLWTAKAHSCVQSWTKSHLRIYVCPEENDRHLQPSNTALLQLHEYSYITKWNRWLYIVISLPQTSFNIHLTRYILHSLLKLVPYVDHSL